MYIYYLPGRELVIKLIFANTYIYYQSMATPESSARAIDPAIVDVKVCDPRTLSGFCQSMRDTCKYVGRTEEEWLTWYASLCEHAAKCGIEIATKNYKNRYHELVVMKSRAEGLNGAVVDARADYSILVPPSPIMLTNMSSGIRKYCMQNIRDYDIYQVVDGTRVTLYYHNGEWLMASARAYDVSGLRWMGPKTYREAFNECAIASGLSTFNYDTLDTSKTYSFIFHHCDFHPLKGDPAKLWQVDGPAIPGLDRHMPINSSMRPNPEKMRVTATNALTDYASTGTINYGYLLRLRADVPDTHQPRAFFFESSLYAAVRNQMYDLPRDIELTHETRPLYIHLRAYLSRGNAASHILLFPRASEVYIKMTAAMGILVNTIVMRMRTKVAGTQTPDGPGPVINARFELSGREAFGNDWNRVRAIIIKLSEDIHNLIGRRGDIGPFGDHVIENVRDLCVSRTYINSYMAILTCHAYART